MNRKTKRIVVISIACLLILFAGEEFLRRIIGGFGGSYPYVEYCDRWVIIADNKKPVRELPAWGCKI